MERSVSVRSDKNNWDHLWRWSTWTSRTEIYHSILTNWLAVLSTSVQQLLTDVVHWRKECKMGRSVPLSWPGLIGKQCSILQQLVPVGPTGRTVKIESTSPPTLVRVVTLCYQTSHYSHSATNFKFNWGTLQPMSPPVIHAISSGIRIDGNDEKFYFKSNSPLCTPLLGDMIFLWSKFLSEFFLA